MVFRFLSCPCEVYGSGSSGFTIPCLVCRGRKVLSQEKPRCINTGKQIRVRKIAQLTENKTPLQKRRRKTASQEIGGRGGSYNPYMNIKPSDERSPENAPPGSDSNQKGRLFRPITSSSAFLTLPTTHLSFSSRTMRTRSPLKVHFMYTFSGFSRVKTLHLIKLEKMTVKPGKKHSPD
jgi:hypothetical protein